MIDWLIVRNSTRHSQLDTRNSRRVIRASELGQYAYCPKAWWLGSVLGVKTTNTHDLHRGEIVHRAHGQQVWWSRALLIVAAVLALAALVMLIGLAR